MTTEPGPSGGEREGVIYRFSTYFVEINLVKYSTEKDFK
jgi:hypothetical protein